jgi:hypothetical protein
VPHRSCRLAAIALATSSLATGLAACGSSDTDSDKPTSTPAAASENKPTSLSLASLLDCAKANAGPHSDAELTDTTSSPSGADDELGAIAPDAVVREAIKAGGWLRLTYSPAESSTIAKVGAIDVLDFGSAAQAAAAKAKALAGTDETGNRVGEYNVAVQTDNLVWVYARTYDDDGTVGIVTGVIGTAQTCLSKLGSPVSLPEPKRVATQPVE